MDLPIFPKQTGDWSLATPPTFQLDLGRHTGRLRFRPFTGSGPPWKVLSWFRGFRHLEKKTIILHPSSSIGQWLLDNDWYSMIWKKKQHLDNDWYSIMHQSFSIIIWTLHCEVHQPCIMINRGFRSPLSSIVAIKTQCPMETCLSPTRSQRAQCTTLHRICYFQRDIYRI